MIKNSKLKIKNSDRGITLVEIIVVIFMIVMFSLIVIADFPTIQRHFALSRSAYKLAQDLRRAEDLGLSGVPLNDASAPPIPILIKGYGLYADASSHSAKEYIIYADVTGAPDINGVSDSDQKYSGDTAYPLCSQVNQALNGTLQTDCALEIMDLSKENPNLYIAGFVRSDGSALSANGISINFRPPNPDINIEDSNLNVYSKTKIGIVLGLTSDPSVTKTVWADTSGLINVQ